MNHRIRRLAWIVTLCGAGSLGVAAQSAPAPSLPAAAAEHAANPAPKKAKHVYTNDDIASSPDAGKAPDNLSAPTVVSLPAGPKVSADQVRETVRKQKANVAAAEGRRDRLQRLLTAAPKSDCRNLYDPSDPQRDLCQDMAKIPDQLKQAQARVDKEKATLQALQDAAKKLGYGSSVYDAN